jgi:uncharacterized protein (TIGR02453 family)
MGEPADRPTGRTPEGEVHVPGADAAQADDGAPIDRRRPVGRSAGPPWSVYILRCADGSLYTGIARDPTRRLAQHNGRRGAAYTRARRPVSLVYAEPARDRSAALRREWAIKRLTRVEKEELIMTTRTTKATTANRAARATGRGPDAKRGTRGAERFASIPPAALRFLTRLKRHNTRPWFKANRAVYETEVRDPLKALVEDVDVHLAAIAPEITGDPRRSIFRIHRDVRFSRDKSPYKTHAACWFYHQDAGRGVGGEAQGGAGFYFHFSPTEVFLGGGIWMPPRESLGRLRQALVDDQEGFEKIVLHRSFQQRFGRLDEETMLKRLPRGFAEDIPAARWLRYQSFTVGRKLSRRELHAPRLTRILARDFQALTPFVRWLNSALGFPPLSRRV